MPTIDTQTDTRTRTGARRCLRCGRPLPLRARASRTFCKDACRSAYNRRRIPAPEEPAEPTSAQLPDPAAQLRALLVELRSRAGLPPLPEDPALAAQAEAEAHRVAAQAAADRAQALGRVPRDAQLLAGALPPAELGGAVDQAELLQAGRCGVAVLPLGEGDRVAVAVVLA